MYKKQHAKSCCTLLGVNKQKTQTLPVLICVTRVTNKIIVNVRLGRRLNANINILYLHRIIISENCVNCVLPWNTWFGFGISGQLSHASPTPSPSRSSWSRFFIRWQLSRMFLIPYNETAHKVWGDSPVERQNTDKSFVIVYMISYRLHPCRRHTRLRGHLNLCLSDLGYPLGHSCHMRRRDCLYRCSADQYSASTSSYPTIRTRARQNVLLFLHSLTLGSDYFFINDSTDKMKRHWKAK